MTRTINLVAVSSSLVLALGAPASEAARKPTKPRAGAAQATSPAAMLEGGVRSFLDEQCVRCHGPDKQKGGARFDTLAPELGDPKALELWQGILDRLSTG